MRTRAPGRRPRGPLVSVRGPLMSRPPTDDHAYLFAHTRLPDFLAFLTRETVDGADADPARLADQWRAGSARFRELQQAEAGWADHPAVGPLPKALEPLVRQVA